MILGRRHPPPLRHRLRGWLWPRIGWRRAGRYLLMRLHRMPGTPHSIAAGFAAGAAIAVTPFLGAHLILAFALAYLTGGNLLAAAAGSMLGNPWTYPLIFAATYELGCLILGQPPHGLSHLATLDGRTLLAKIQLLLWPMLVGCIPIAALVWIGSYLPLVRAIAVVQERRRARREARLHALRETTPPE
jgi:uncharacterized protein (DUF2062 family)